MDGLLVRPELVVDAEMARRHPNVTPSPHHPHFYTEFNYPPEYREEIRSIIGAPGFFESLPLEVGAIEGLERILRAGHWPRICTSAIKKIAESCTAEKLAWIEHHLVPAFGPWILDEAIIRPDKHKAEGDVLLDDRPSVTGAGRAKWRHVLFIPPDTSYGLHVDTPFKVYGWQDRNLEPILAHCVRRPMPRTVTPVELS